jgi:hypothetical protein
MPTLKQLWPYSCNHPADFGKALMPSICPLTCAVNRDILATDKEWRRWHREERPVAGLLAEEVVLRDPLHVLTQVVGPASTRLLDAPRWALSGA